MSAGDGDVIAPPAPTTHLHHALASVETAIIHIAYAYGAMITSGVEDLDWQIRAVLGSARDIVVGMRNLIDGKPADQTDTAAVEPPL
jgi:hypothetical protein